MRLAQVEEAIKRLCIRIDEKRTELILQDALVLLENTKTSALKRGVLALQMLRFSLPVRLATAAAIIVFAYVGAGYLAVCLGACSDSTALTIELASQDISRLFGF
ncbi:MAG TPA: hypothetical protein HPP87_09170 [Planctomycetes bacterium]|nr:hypothetical protein [Planctomycetota bacterium]